MGQKDALSQHCKGLGIALWSKNLISFIRESHLEIECFSEESGMCFQEHYLYDHGECRIDACVDWNQYYYDEDEYESFEDFKERFDLPEDLTEDDLDDGDYYSIGGFPDYCEFSI